MVDSNFSRWLISAAFLVHGIGMLGAGLTLPMAIRKTDSGFGHSWFFERCGTQVEAVAGTILWGLAGIGFIGAAVGLFMSQNWWVLFAWVGAPATLLAVLLWFGAVPMGTYAGGVLAALTLGALIFRR